MVQHSGLRTGVRVTPGVLEDILWGMQKKVINSEQSKPDLGLDTGEPDARSFHFGEPFLSLSL
jgi:hypothetical protein